MGIITRLLSVLGKRTTAQDNFESIALNMALIRHCLMADHSDRFTEEDEILVTCGVLDTLMHIRDGHFAVDDIRHGLVSAKIGQLFVGLTTVFIEEDEMKTLFMGPTNLFLNFVLQIEAMVFEAGERFLDPSGLSDRDIAYSVLSQKSRIADVLNTPAAQLERTPGFAGVRELVGAFLGTPEFAELRAEIKDSANAPRED